MLDRKNKQGFSLLEILVAISVISILIMIVGFGIKKAWTVSDTVLCQSRLKTLGGAVHSYIADHEGRFPPTPLYYYLDAEGNRKEGRTYDALMPYLDGVREFPTWHCPADRDRRVASWRWSYGQNRYMGGAKAMRTTAVTGTEPTPNPAYDPRYALIHAVPKPLSEILYLVDYISEDRFPATDALTASVWPLARNSDSVLPGKRRIDFSRHHSHVNALFLDGSVRRMTVRDLMGTEATLLLPEY